MARPARVSPDRILAAAAAEFAARGFAGARVDRIARTARVNKAMLYYHFRSKQALYRAVLRDQFRQAAARLDAVARLDLPAPERLDRLVAAIAEHLAGHATLPSIMLREVAEGGAHLDRETVASLALLPQVVAKVVIEGTADGSFGDVQPLFAYLTLLAPLVVYFAGAGIRRELAGVLGKPELLAPELFVRHLQETMRRALAPDGRS